MAIDAATRRTSHALTLMLHAVADDQLAGGNAPGPYQRPPRVGTDGHVLHAPVNRRDVLDREQENRRRVLVDQLHRGPPVPAGLLAVERRAGLINEAVERHARVSQVVGLADSSLRPGLVDPGRWRRVGVPGLDQGIELARL